MSKCCDEFKNLKLTRREKELIFGHADNHHCECKHDHKCYKEHDHKCYQERDCKHDYKHDQKHDHKYKINYDCLDCNTRIEFRKLWSEHAIYTKFYIISVLANISDANLIAERLLQNQQDT